MAIRADVARLQSIAGQLRRYSGRLESERSAVNGKVESMLWKGNAYSYFINEYAQVRQNMKNTADELLEFASRLERLAEEFRQEDLEKERIEREKAEAERRRAQAAQAAAQAAKAALRGKP